MRDEYFMCNLSFLSITKRYLISLAQILKKNVFFQTEFSCLNEFEVDLEIKVLLENKRHAFCKGNWPDLCMQKWSKK